MIKEAMILEVLQWYLKAPLAQQFDFKTCTEADLIDFHHTLGRDIRNAFNLWESSWIPEIVDGADISPGHPDQISMDIIKEVWRLVNV